MSLKTRIALLTLLPLLLMMGAIGLAGYVMSEGLAASQSALFRERLLAARQDELRRLLDLAASAVAPVLNDPGRDEAQARADARRILTALRFDENGYFFLYDGAGVNLAHPIQPELQGRDLSDLRDSRGCPVIRELLAVARHGGGHLYEDQDRPGCYVLDALAGQGAAPGGGFLRYRWHNPATGGEAEKLGLVTLLPGRDWMLGTGLYYDDIDHGVALARDQVTANIRHSFTLILGVLGLTTLIAAALVWLSNLQQGRLADRHLQALAHRHVNLQIEERRRFARELHDGINQLLVAAKFRIDLALTQAARGKPGFPETLETALTTLDAAIEEVRRVSHGLRPALLDTQGLGPALADLLDAFAERAGIATAGRFCWDGAVLGEDQEIILYRVAQEALTNCERHAAATRVELDLARCGEGVRLEIRDDGRGLPLDRPPGAPGMGLRNMRERVELLGGQFHIHSNPGQGTQIRATLPVRTADREEA